MKEPIQDNEIIGLRVAPDVAQGNNTSERISSEVDAKVFSLKRASRFRISSKRQGHLDMQFCGKSEEGLLSVSLNPMKNMTAMN